ncbi:PREDICTED: mitotic spindle assembly checkpoint protein MAD1 isoform X3 [Brassica oleracea var. oleracea]|uniref:mitotic spindle assembly checkpoint protein MAD1 isoform X3 n=1 Tax=Brassica oleracea var. oleracea TaxID=109376 RepID=UPI0006A6CFE3|nr:PREDICTED: mitotic spindle assembly checkpoint protein MAD1 isoform X3 [Brassica oleracea var. oleracea]
MSKGLTQMVSCSQIFGLAILLSSVFIYGPTLGVDDIALDLSRLLEISKHDHVGDAKDNTFKGLGQFSPMFVQLMTDINSETVESADDVTLNNKVEALRPQLLYGVNALVKFVSERVRPKKRGDSTIVTGPPLAAFTKSFSENVNNSVIPKISSLWLSVEESEGRKACDTATEVYMSSLERAETPQEESMLIEAHNKAVAKALDAFCESSIGNDEVKQRYKRELWSFFAKAIEDHKRVADMEAYSRCCNAIEDMGKKLWALPCSRDANSSDIIKALDTAVAEYEVSINGPMKWQTLSSFLKKSIQDILVHRRGNQMEELLSENSKLKLQHRSMESTIDLLSKQLEGGEKMRKEYQKRYEGAIHDMNKLSDQFKNRIHDLESKCKSIHDEHSNLMEVLGSTRLEAAEWKRKFEGTLDENGVSNASIKRCDRSIDWKIKYENTISEQKAVSEKIAAMEERLKQASAKEDGMRAEFSRVLDEKENVITEKDAKLATLEQLLSSTRSELKKSELKVKECSLEAKDLRVQVSDLNEKCESMISAAKSRENETQALKQERDYLDKKHLSHMEELGKLCLRLEDAESEASSAKKLADLLRLEAEAAQNNEKSLQTSLAEKCTEIERAKSRIQELEKVCLKLDSEESEASASKELVDSMKREANALRMNVNELQTSLQDKCIEIDQANCRIEELEKICLKLKDAEDEAATAKELASSMKTEVESARYNENKLQALLQEKNIEIDNLGRQKNALSETLEKRAKQNEEAVAEWHRIINAEKEKNMRVNTMQRVDSFMVSDEATPMQRVKRLKVEASVTSSGSVFETEEDTASQESGRAMSAMTPRRCTSSGGGGGESSSTGMDHSKYTMKKLRDEILKHGFGAELVGLKNARKSVLVELYERCVLRK